MSSAIIRQASSGQRLGFYGEWNDATYVPEAADSFAIGEAFDALIKGTDELPKLDAASLLEYALARSFDMRRMEIAHQAPKPIHGAEWTEVETWDRVSHLGRWRLAWVET